MACPSCGCKVVYPYDDDNEPEDDRLQRCSACGHVFDLDDHADEEDDHEDQPRERQDFGCCFPGECCMPSLHFPSECHTAAMYEASHPMTSDPKPVANIEDMKP